MVIQYVSPFLLCKTDVNTLNGAFLQLSLISFWDMGKGFTAK